MTLDGLELKRIHRIREIIIYDVKNPKYVFYVLPHERLFMAAVLFITGGKPSTWLPPGGPLELDFV